MRYPTLVSIPALVLLGPPPGALVGTSRDLDRPATCLERATGDQFSGFFQRTLGRWSVFLTNFDEQGARSHQGRQERTFAWMVGREYLAAELVYARPAPSGL
ncbi:MAG TPA: hypothetical protein VF981_12265 [Gemmatimonadaceae bacterium]